MDNYDELDKYHELDYAPTDVTRQEFPCPECKCPPCKECGNKHGHHAVYCAKY